MDLEERYVIARFIQDWYTIQSMADTPNKQYFQQGASNAKMVSDSLIFQISAIQKERQAQQQAMQEAEQALQDQEPAEEDAEK